MKIEYVTNASFLFTFSDGTKILTDPWYTDGIYHGTMFNFPPLSSDEKDRYLNCKPDYLYISHLHGDHLDRHTLQEFDKQTPVLIGKFPTPALSLALRSLEFTNLLEFEFDQIHDLGKHKIRIYKQFSGSSDDIDDPSGEVVDTSIFVEDTDGSKVFFAVDNPMQDRHAEFIKSEHGKLDVAILAYSGASIYPFVFRHYSDSEKCQRVGDLRRARLDKFVRLAKIIGAKHSVPAAGSMVLSGVAAKHARYMHQAVPSQIAEAWDRSGMNSNGLLLMATGDEFDIKTGQTLKKETNWRNYSERDRIEYARSMSDFPCDIQQIRWPKSLPVPWKRLIAKARSNMWSAQQKVGVNPPAELILVVKNDDAFEIDSGRDFYVGMDLQRALVEFCPDLENPHQQMRIEYHLSTTLLFLLLTGCTYWNVAEYHMEINRSPDQFEPSINRLLAYFKL